MDQIRQIWESREVVYNLVRRDLKVRYKNSALGFFWSFLNPLLQILVLLFVFKYVLRQSEANLSVKLFCTFLPWLFFSQSLLDGSYSVARHLPLIKKVYFPRQVLPLSSLLSNFVHFLLSLVVLTAVFGVVRVTVAWPYLWLAALALLLQTILAYGMMLLAAALSTLYEDIRFLLQALLNLWFFLSPIMYSIHHVIDSERLSPLIKQVYLLNPMAPILVAYRTVLPLNEPFPGYYLHLAYSAGVALLLLWVGLGVFRAMEPYFPERA